MAAAGGAAVRTMTARPNAAQRTGAAAPSVDKPSAPPAAMSGAAPTHISDWRYIIEGVWALAAGER